MSLWHRNCTSMDMERYLTGLVALLLFGATAALFGYIPIVPAIVTALILTVLVLMFVLGFYVGAHADLKLLGQADWMPPDAAAQPTVPEKGDCPTAREDAPQPPNDSTRLAA